MPRIKNEKVFFSLMVPGVDPTLARLVCWVWRNFFQEKHNNGAFVITSAHRPGDRGVHGTNPCRGIDIRSHNVTNPSVIVEKINAEWQYDPERPEKPCALFHDIGQGEHIHLQTHPNTRRKR